MPVVYTHHGFQKQDMQEHLVCVQLWHLQPIWHYPAVFPEFRSIVHAEDYLLLNNVHLFRLRSQRTHFSHSEKELVIQMLNNQYVYIMKKNVSERKTWNKTLITCINNYIRIESGNVIQEFLNSFGWNITVVISIWMC